jgi:hypothetical protein
MSMRALGGCHEATGARAVVGLRDMKVPTMQPAWLGGGEGEGGCVWFWRQIPVLPAADLTSQKGELERLRETAWLFFFENNCLEESNNVKN